MKRHVASLPVVAAITLASLSTPALAQDNFWQQFNAIKERGNPSTSPNNLGNQGIELTNSCRQGYMSACRKMEDYGRQWCYQRSDCTYLVHLMETECALGDRKACATADQLRQKAVNDYQKRWGKPGFPR